eukprot:6242571-Pyramimonas_sp.AAC.1
MSAAVVVSCLTSSSEIPRPRARHVARLDRAPHGVLEGRLLLRGLGHGHRGLRAGAPDVAWGDPEDT